MTKDDAEVIAVCVSNQILIMKSLALIMAKLGMNEDAIFLNNKADETLPLIRGNQ